MSRRALIGLVLVLAVVLAGMVLRFRAGAGRTGNGEGAPADNAPAGALSPRVQPSRANVDPGFQKEVAALQHRVAVNPRDTAALLRLARLHQDAHQPAPSADFYRRYLALAPADRQAWLDLAAVTAATGDWAGALRATDTLLARDSLDVAALFNRGAILANRGETAEARLWWQRAAAQTRDRELAGRAAASLRQLGGAR